MCGHQTVDVLPPPSLVTPIEVNLTNQKACTSTSIASESESPGLKSHPASSTTLKRKRALDKLESNYKNKKLDPAYFKLSANSSEHVHCSACNVNLSIGGSNGFSNVYAHNRRSQHSNAVKKCLETKLKEKFQHQQSETGSQLDTETDSNLSSNVEGSDSNDRNSTIMMK